MLQKVATHQRLAGMLLLGDHLQQDAARDVLLTLLVNDHELDAFHDQLPYIRQRDVAALDRVVQPTIRILLDDPRFAHCKPP